MEIETPRPTTNGRATHATSRSAKITLVVVLAAALLGVWCRKLEVQRFRVAGG
jgi:hypothetical protein